MGISPLAGPTYLFTHLLVVPLAGLFVFACLIAIQTILAALLHQRLLRAVSVTVQLLLVVTLIEMLIYSPAISAWLRDYATTLATPGESSWLPPLWFLGLYETLLGTDMASFHRLATRALAVTGGVLALAVAAYAFGYRRIFRRAVEGAGPLHQGAGRLARLGPRIWTSLSSNATQQAVIAFVTRGLARSRRHRLVLAIYLGVALAFILGGVIRPLSDGLAITTDAPTVMLLSIPLILSFFTLVGLRVLFAIPTEVRANWVFKMTERNEKQAYLQASRKTMVLLGLGPLALITFPMYWSLWGPELAAQHTLIWLLLGALLTEALLVRFDKVPLACEYLPGKANVKLLWPVYLAVMMSYGYTTARIELALLGNPRRWGIAVGLLSLGLLAALASRRRWLAPAPRLTYEEAPEHTVQQLHLMRPV